MIDLPPEDRERSPHTGWTRAHWEAIADRLLDGVRPYAADGLSRYHLPGPPSRSGVDSDGLEGFARTFLLAAFRLAGAGGHDPSGLLERYATGLIEGVSHTWPPLADRSQQLVEAASIAVALHETRQWLFDRLAPAERGRVVGWLAGMVGRETPVSNWILFQVVVEQFLASVDGPYDRAEITGGLDRIEPWYRGDGWYSDGDGQNYDYYCGWAMHLYPLLWARMSGDTARGDVYRDRLREFLRTYPAFFARDGSPVHQGRSLTYRFATVVPFWLGALTGATPLAPGATRRLASGTLRHFATHGAPDANGLLSLGWHGGFRPMIQPYSGPASPYWASKAFLGLLLPDDHPVWTEREEEPPVAEVTALAGPGWLLHGNREVVRLVNHGSDRADKSPEPDPFYLRFGYSTHTAPQLGVAGPADNHLAVGTSQRRRIARIAVHDRFAASAYDDGEVHVTTASVVSADAEVRVHAVTAPAGLPVREGGYPVAAALPPAGSAGPVAAEAGAQGRVAAEAGAHVRAAAGLVSTVVSLAGFDGAEIRRHEGADAYGPHSAVPCLTADAHPGGTRLYVSLIALGHPPDVRLTLLRGTAVTLRWPDGGITAVDLGDHPRYARRDADGTTVATWG